MKYHVIARSMENGQFKQISDHPLPLDTARILNITHVGQDSKIIQELRVDEAIELNNKLLDQ